MTNPAFAVDGAMDALQAVSKSISRARVPISRELVHLRASQINGCSVCVDTHAKAARRSGEDAIWDAAAVVSAFPIRRRTSPATSCSLVGRRI